jgi:Tfp pilus assembly protein PilN
MNTALHLDLLKDEERYSSNPVRLRVMTPMLALFAALGIGLWWGLYALGIHNQSLLKSDLQNEIAELTPAYNALLALRAQEGDIAATTRQIQLYRNARIRFGETVAKVAQVVPENMQLTELRVPPPPPFVLDPKSSALGPTNTVELVTLRISGRTTGTNSSEAVNALLTALLTPAFTNLIRSAEIPKGAFRQDLAKNPGNREALLFELSCGCVPRRFE